MTSPAETFDRLTRLGDYERRAREGTLHTLLGDLSAGIAALAGDPLGEALRVLHRALRIDLAFLVEHPGATFACLHHRCSWHGTPEAAVHRDLRAGQAASPASPSGAETPLHRAMRRWRAAKEASGAPWLRPLRPPEIALDGALLEEYRAEAARYSRRVRLGEDGRRVELLVGPLDSDPAAPFASAHWARHAWDRETGRKIHDDVVELLPRGVSPDGRLRVAHDGWGDASVRRVDDNAVVRRLPISDSRNGSAAAWSEDGRRFALAGWDDDSGGFLMVLDAATGAVVMEVNEDSSLFEVALSSRGDRVAVSGSRETTVRDVASRAILRRYPLRHATVAFSPDRTNLLTAELGVVRVWDLDERASLLHGYREGLSNAAFSPDGERLVTGSWICHALTGAPIARLDFASPHYLEGGPPRDAFALGTERLVCLERGVEVWDARTGARLVQDHGRQYVHWVLVAISPDGGCYALVRDARYSDESAKLTVLGTERGEERGEVQSPAVRCMVWAPDGTTLVTGGADGAIRAWDAALREPPRVIPAHRGPVTELSFTREGTLMSGAKDEEPCVWDLFTGRRSPAPPPGEGDVQWKARDGSIVFLDVATGAEIAWLPVAEELRRHPREPIWAGGPVHVKLEGRRGR